MPHGNRARQRRHAARVTRCDRHARCARARVRVQSRESAGCGGRSARVCAGGWAKAADGGGGRRACGWVGKGSGRRGQKARLWVGGQGQRTDGRRRASAIAGTHALSRSRSPSLLRAWRRRLDLGCLLACSRAGLVARGAVAGPGRRRALVQTPSLHGGLLRAHARDGRPAAARAGGERGRQDALPPGGRRAGARTQVGARRASHSDWRCRRHLSPSP
jgi:hypothetical protein